MFSLFNIFIPIGHVYWGMGIEGTELLVSLVDAVVEETHEQNGENSHEQKFVHACVLPCGVPARPLKDTSAVRLFVRIEVVVHGVHSDHPADHY